MTSQHRRHHGITSRGRPPVVAVLALAVAALLVAACQPTAEDAADAEPAQRELSFRGPEDGLLVAAADLDDLEFVVIATGAPETDDLGFLLDGEPVTGSLREDGELVYSPGDALEDGERIVAVRRAIDDPPEDGPTHEQLHEWRVVVDTVPPELEITSPDTAVVDGEPALVTGLTEPDATVVIAGDEVEVDEAGGFSTERDHDDGRVRVVATDPAGNATEVVVEQLVVPSRVRVDEVRGVHVSFYGWADRRWREPILEMAEEGRINTVQLDLKDESGGIAYDSQVPLAREIGAAEAIFDLEAAVTELHGRGIHVVGRIVAFRDPVLAEWAWANGERDMVIQTPDGGPYAGYGGFTSFGNPDVVEYNLAIAEEAAAAGVDAILWDYIRRPDGPVENLVVAGLPGDAGDRAMEQAIVDFTAAADERLAPYGVEHGASVYGIAATRAHEIAQDIEGMAQHVDYVAPMVYPSHWARDEFGIDDPNRRPYDIVHRALEEFIAMTEAAGARVVPWLEDSEYRAWDRREQVSEQIRAAGDHGIDEWLMWDPYVRYTREAYPPRE